MVFSGFLCSAEFLVSDFGFGVFTGVVDCVDLGLPVVGVVIIRFLKSVGFLVFRTWLCLVSSL